MKYDLAVVIGRFQPFHNGHLQVVKTAAELAEKVLVLVGSANASKSPRNPWTYLERAYMIGASTKALKVQIRPINDHLYNLEEWIEEVQNRVKKFYPKKVCVVGHSKDSTSYYLKLFPQWDSIECDNTTRLNATDIRNNYFRDQYVGLWDAPNPVREFLFDWVRHSDYEKIQKEYYYYENYNPRVYDIIMTTVDAVITCSGHILLICRKNEPGKGLWALPGGFIHSDETLLDAAVRELKEETRIKLPEKIIKNPTSQDVFDEPNRSLRGRVITYAFHYALEPGKLPEVRGSDDADKASWVPLSQVNPQKLFEDHYHIIRYFV